MFHHIIFDLLCCKNITHKISTFHFSQPHDLKIQVAWVLVDPCDYVLDKSASFGKYFTFTRETCEVAFGSEPTPDGSVVQVEQWRDGLQVWSGGVKVWLAQSQDGHDLPIGYKDPVTSNVSQ